MLQSFRKIPFRLIKLVNFTKAPEKMSEVKIVRKARYDGRVKKRQWEERRTDKGEGLGTTKSKIIKKETEITTDLLEKIKRRKFAVLLGYSGTDYYGMQRNPNMKTIEEDLFQALLDNEYITQENFAQVQTMQYQRAARTDKGVSAARQMVSMKLPEVTDVSKINEKLPQTIRVFGIKRVTKGFNSKSNCDSRTYFYMLPTVAFAPSSVEMNQIGFRLDESLFNKVNETLQKFLGTKNYHNFTSKKKPTDPSAKRYMKSFYCDKPFVKQDVEFAVLKVQGQSFMMHQIRKMVGLLIAVIKGYTSEKTLSLAFEVDKVNIPRAPGLGLVLDYVHYDRYNVRYGADGMHETLEWNEVEKDVEEFKENHIYPIIIETELKEQQMVNWISEKLAGHTYDDSGRVEEDDDEEKSDDEEAPNKIAT